MAYVDNSQITPLYANTTPGLTADATVFDPAIAALIVAINENFDLFEQFKAAVTLPIPDQSIVERHLRNAAVTNPKLAPLAVTADKIADGTIATAKLADLVITAAKIADGTITEPKYGTGSVSKRAIANNSIDASKMDSALFANISDIAINTRFGKVDNQLNDIYINVKYPPAPYMPVSGDGLTDDTAIIQSMVDYAIANGKKLYFPKSNYVITDTILFQYGSGTLFTGGFGFGFIGENVSETVFLMKMTGKPAFKLTNINNGALEHGIEMASFTLKKYSDAYNQVNDGVVLVNCVGNLHSNIYIKDCINGILLTSDKNTAIGSGNTGYSEQNVFTDVTVSECINSVTFRVGANDDWNSSFHGNIFERCVFSVIGTSTQEARALNIESGLIYNCTFNIKMFTSGPNTKLIHFNGDSLTNTGTISYEVFGSTMPKISTGDNAVAKFFFNGNIYGLGTVDWSDYKTVQVGELDYSNGKTPIAAGNSILGRDKFYSRNLLPNKQITAINLYGKSTKLKPVQDVIDDLYQGIMHYFCKYQNTTGSQENGFIMACKEVSGAGARFIIGTIPPEKNDIQDFVPGFYLRSTGSHIESVPNAMRLNFNNLGIGTNGSTINVATSRTPASATATGTKGDICYDSNYMYVCVATNTWKRVAITTW
jgi:hypothetical protein